MKNHFMMENLLKQKKMKKNILMHSKKIKFYFLQELNTTYLNGIIKVN